MWYLIIVLLCGSSIAQYTVANYYRFNLGGGFYVGVWEFALFFGFILSFLLGGRYDAELPKYRKSSLFILTVTLCTLSAAIGFFGDMVYGNDIKDTISNARDFLAFPLTLYIGYRMTPRLSSIKPLLYGLVVCGVITATLLIIHFGQNAEVAGERNSFNAVRSTNYVSAFAGIACLMLTFSASYSRLKILPTVPAVCIAGYCLVGQWAPLNRGDWVACIVCFCLLIVFTPKGRRSVTLFRGIVAIPILLLALWFGVQLASYASQRDVGKKIYDRFSTILPSENYSKEDKAWDVRWPAAAKELELWLSSPLTGVGFGAEDRYIQQTGVVYWGFNHNGWASVLAKTGVIGFAGSFLVYFSMIILGRKILVTAGDPAVALFGFVASITGVMLFINVVVTMSWTTRNAVLYGIIGGIAFKVNDLLAIEQVSAEVDYGSYAGLEFALE